MGSTTAKMVVSDADGNIVHSIYERHGARIREVLSGFLDGLQRKVGDADVSVCITGSVGMGVAENTGLPFIQEVVAARGYYPSDTPIWNYDPDFVAGVLVGAWDQVLAMIRQMWEKEEIPFN